MIELVGRTAELAAATGVVAGTTSEAAVLIEGAPGIGKTVLFDAAAQAARAAGALVLETRPTEADAHIAFLGLHDLLDPVLPEAVRVLQGPQRARLERALNVGPEPDQEPLEGGQLALAVVAAARGLAVRRRVVLAIDDLQWLDASTAAVLGIALARLHDADVRLIATVRDADEPADRLPVERLFRDRLVLLRLGGMDLGALHRLLSDRLGRSVPRPTLVRIHALAQGNPLHALELARSLSQDQQSGDALDTALPADVAGLLRRRVDRLAPATRELLAVVALTPRPSSETVARALDIPAGEVEGRAGDALDDGLLVAASKGFALGHPLVGAAVRASLRPAARRALHRRLADVVTDPDQAAVHLSLSAAGANEVIAAALEAAARRGLARGATVDAIDNLARTVELTPENLRDDIVRRRLLLVRALVLAGDTGRAARELAALDTDAIPDPERRAEATLLLGVVQRYRGEHAAAIESHEAALRWPVGPETRALLHARLAWLNERALGSALGHAEAALALLDARSAPLDYSFALLTRARLRLELGLSADHEDVARGQALQASAGEWDWNVSTTPIDWAIWMDDWATARALLEVGARAAEEAGDETLAGHLLRRRAEVETWSGALALAGALAQASLERAQSTQQGPAIVSAMARIALVHAHAGPIEMAVREADEALRLADELGNPVILGYATTAATAAATARGSLDRVIEVGTRAMAALDATGHVDQAAHRFHADLLNALVGTRNVDAARALADRLERRGALGPRPTWSAIAERGRAQIGLVEGDLDEAARHIELALRRQVEARVPFESARTLIVAGEVERRHGRRKAAAARLGEALEILDRIGAVPLAGRVREQLGRPAGERFEADGLTPSEARIAILAAEGSRNRQIAQQLGISEKTVEAALGRTYDKLGIRSRAQLGAALRTRGHGS